MSGLLEATGLRRRSPDGPGLGAGADLAAGWGRWSRLLRRRGVVAGLAILAAVVLFCLLVPLLRGIDVLDQSGPQFEPPGAQWPFGTDQRGGDVLVRIADGGRRSIGGAAAVMVLVVMIGLAVGLAAASGPRWLDTLLMRTVDVFNGVPPLLVPIVVVAVLGTGFTRLTLAIVVGYAPAYVRIARTFALSARRRADVVSARLFGIGTLRVVAGHVLPGVVTSLVVIATLDFGSVIITLASLSYLGLGAQAPTPEWGVLLDDGQTYFSAAPWLLLAPTVAILLVTTAANLVGESIRDALETGGRR